MGGALEAVFITVFQDCQDASLPTVELLVPFSALNLHAQACRVRTRIATIVRTRKRYRRRWVTYTGIAFRGGLVLLPYYGCNADSSFRTRLSRFQNADFDTCEPTSRINVITSITVNAADHHNDSSGVEL